MFGKRLKEAMNEKGMNATALSAATGIGKSSISQYLSGKNEPRAQKRKIIAEVLGLPEDYFEVDETLKESICSKTRKISVAMAAELMSVGKQCIRAGIRDQSKPIGSATRISKTKFTYYISPAKLAAHMGITFQELQEMLK